MGKIEICGIDVVFKRGKDEFKALENINAVIEEGEFVCIVGSSGCGKSTLLGVLEGLITPSCGKVLIDGVQINGPGPERAVVFQQYTLFPWMTALQNVIFGIKQVKKTLSHEQLNELALEFLGKVGLSEFADKLPGELSGGMQQRVAIARALSVNPKILLMDEPFGAIDAKTRVSLQELLLKLWNDDAERKTVVFVTHDIDEALLLSDTIIFMEPKKINQIIKVNLPRPRKKESLFENGEYRQLRGKLVGLFYQEVMEKIGGEEVYL